MESVAPEVVLTLISHLCGHLCSLKVTQGHFSILTATDWLHSPTLPLCKLVLTCIVALHLTVMDDVDRQMLFGRYHDKGILTVDVGTQM